MCWAELCCHSLCRMSSRKLEKILQCLPETIRISYWRITPKFGGTSKHAYKHHIWFKKIRKFKSKNAFTNNTLLSGHSTRIVLVALVLQLCKYPVRYAPLHEVHAKFKWQQRTLHYNKQIVWLPLRLFGFYFGRNLFGSKLWNPLEHIRVLLASAGHWTQLSNPLKSRPTDFRLQFGLQSSKWQV